jgi:hypothetical protein
VKARLFCKTGLLKGTSCTVGRETTIGKDSTRTLCLYPAILSRNHARIFFDEKQGCYLLEDLNSRNGTWLDGSRVTQREKLHNLHVITFANQFDFIFQILEETPSSRRSPGRREHDEATRIEAPVVNAGGTRADDRTEIGGEMPPMLLIGGLPGGRKKEEAMDDKTCVDTNVLPPPPIPIPQDPGDRTEKLDRDRGSK